MKRLSKKLDRMSDNDLWAELLRVLREQQQHLDDWAYSSDLKLMNARARTCASELYLRGVQMSFFEAQGAESK